MGPQSRPLRAGRSYSSCIYAFPEVAGARLPESIQDCTIGEEADEPVSHSDFMEEGLLGLHDVSVWHPEELHQAGVQGDALVAFEHQPPVGPALSEVYGGGVVLRGRGREWTGVKSLPHLLLGQEHRLYHSRTRGGGGGVRSQRRMKHLIPSR